MGVASAKTRNYLNVVWVLGLFAFSFGLLNKSGYLLMAAIGAVLLFFRGSFRFPMIGVFLLLFSVTYTCIYSFHFGLSLSGLCTFLFAPLGSFLIGQAFVRGRGKEKRMLAVLSAISIGFFLHAVLNLFAQIFLVEPINEYSRLAYDIWHDDYVSVTVVGLLYSPMIGFSVGLLFSRVDNRLKALALVSLFACLMYSMELAHRTTLIVIVVVFVVAVLRLLRESHVSHLKKVKLLFFITICLLSMVFLFSSDMFGIRSWAENQILYIRLTDAEAARSDSRMIIWMSFIKECLMYPQGGCSFDLAYGASYVHNMWLDIYYRTGMIPFVAAIAATVASFSARKAVDRSLGVDPLVKNISTCVLVSLFLSFMVEPVLEANPYVLFGCLIIIGGLFGLLEKDQ